MNKPIGDIIREQRRAHNMTQEELAELLRVSGQAVSKWENGTSMPDISLILPIATVFGISTDVLFDRAGMSDQDAVWEIIREADKMLYDENGILSQAGLYQAYRTAREALDRYPANMTLLMYCLEKGIGLAYPENHTYDPEHASEIYRECIREAGIVIARGQNASDILRAHMIMVILHASNGHGDRAAEHARQFPWRADLTVHAMLAFIHHAEGKYEAESVSRQNDLYYHLEAMLYDMGSNGCALMKMERYGDAVTCFASMLALIESLFKTEPLPPPLHLQEVGNAYVLLAKAHLKNGEQEQALTALEGAAGYELNVRPRLAYPVRVQSPLFRDVEATPVYRAPWPLKGYVEILLGDMRGEAFATLQGEARYEALIEQLTTALTVETE